MQVMVTGGAGFIGSHVVDQLIDAGHEVHVVDNLSSGSRENINKRAHFYNCDVASAELDSVLTDHPVDYVCHLAAQSNVGISRSNPLQDASANVMGSVNLFSLCRRH